MRLRHGKGAIGPSMMRKHLPVGDLLRRHEQAIAAELAAPAVHDAVALHFEQDLLEEFPRDVLAGGDLADHQRVAFLGERHQGAEGIFCFLRDHGRNAILK